MEMLEMIKMVVMWLIGFLLIYLAIKKEYEPTLLLPIGFGAILVNLPRTGVLNQYVEGIGEVNGIIEWLYGMGIEASEAFPILLFIGIGAMIDFEPLLQKPILVLYGFAAHFGIFVAIGLALLMGFNVADSFSIGIIGAADGPTAILMSQILNSNYMGPIAVVAYSYMALVPIIMPATIKCITSKKERAISMPIKKGKKISKTVKIIFPIAVTILSGFVAPMSISLVGFLMFGNLIRECGVLNALSKTAQDVLTNLITLLLGITIAFSMTADKFLQIETLFIMLIGLVAFIFDTVGGVLAAKIMNLFLKEKINPMVGAAGISAFPMASRVVQKMAGEEKPGNIILMQAVGANVSGQVASAIIGGILLGLF
ncbi:MAG: sodium ion-translocating decarboxylase subunit beta [Lachnospiraceae bacterium]|nr:sodium ion-translocating decarboxylase subunit beta [Lachnospiraceae bacterium]